MITMSVTSPGEEVQTVVKASRSRLHFSLEEMISLVCDGLLNSTRPRPWNIRCSVSGLAAAHAQGLQPQGYVGCYKDEGNPMAFRAYSKNFNDLTPQKCKEFCYSKGYLYSATQGRCTPPQDSRKCGYTAFSYGVLPPVASARIQTRDSFSFRYGVVEIRAKLPKGDWLVPRAGFSILAPLGSIFFPPPGARFIINYKLIILTMLEFWQDKNNWKSSWSEEGSSLYIDHVRVIAL